MTEPTKSSARRVVAELLTVPWAARAEWIAQMLAIAERRNLSPEALAAEMGQPLDNTRTVTVRDGIATIPINGMMFRYANIFADVSGATSYEVLATDLHAALTDPQVKAVLLSVDSQGGEVFGAAELSDMIFNARGQKPIVAHIGGFAASAAYWIASAADEIVSASTGIMGSLGVAMTVTVPGEGPDENGDREIEFVSSQSPDKRLDPTSKAGREQRQAIVDQLAGVFVADVARNRGVGEATVLDRYGKGACYVGGDAVKAGMADRIATFEATHRALAEKVRSGGVLLFRRPAASVERPAASSTLLADMLKAVGLDSAVRFAASAHPIPALPSGSVRPIPPAPASAAATPTAPKADSMKESVMSDTPGAPAAGADALAAFKQRLASVKNLCAAAGFPEKAVEFAESDKSVDVIATELFALKKAKNVPDPLEAAASGVRAGADRAADRPFANLGEQLQAIIAAGSPSGARIGGLPGGVIDPRLMKIQAAVSGASANVGADGGYLIQKDFTTELFKEGFGSGTLASKCSKTEIGANADGLEVTYVEETSRATGSRWGGVQIYRGAEGDSAAAKKPKLGKWERRLEDLIGAAYLTERLIQDAPAMQGVFLEAFTDEFAFVIDDEIYNGTGAAQCQGVVGATCTVSVAKETGQAAATVVAKNIEKMWARILPRSKTRGEWFINTEVNPQLAEMSFGVGTGGQLVYVPPGGLSAAPFGTLKGRPINEIEQAAALGTVGDIAFLDLSMYKLISKGGISADDSIHVRFLNNERTLRWIARVNGAPKLKTAITPYKGSSTLSSFVTLATRA